MPVGSGQLTVALVALGSTATVIFAGQVNTKPSTGVSQASPIPSLLASAWSWISGIRAVVISITNARHYHYQLSPGAIAIRIIHIICSTAITIITGSTSGDTTAIANIPYSIIISIQLIWISGIRAVIVCITDASLSLSVMVPAQLQLESYTSSEVQASPSSQGFPQNAAIITTSPMPSPSISS